VRERQRECERERERESEGKKERERERERESVRVCAALLQLSQLPVVFNRLCYWRGVCEREIESGRERDRVCCACESEKECLCLCCSVSVCVCVFVLCFLNVLGCYLCSHSLCFGQGVCVCKREKDRE